MMCDARSFSSCLFFNPIYVLAKLWATFHWYPELYSAGENKNTTASEKKLFVNMQPDNELILRIIKLSELLVVNSHQIHGKTHIGKYVYIFYILVYNYTSEKYTKAFVFKYNYTSTTLLLPNCYVVVYPLIWTSSEYWKICTRLTEIQQHCMCNVASVINTYNSFLIISK